MPLTALKNWWMALRPKTLTAALAPVLMGTAMAYGDGLEHFPTAALCLLAALTIQIGTNIANDYYDFKKGADTSERIGPTRVTQAGLIAPGAVRNAFIVVFAVSFLACVALAYRGGWPVIVLSIVSILSGILYTAGPKPLGYIGLGDAFVLIFFGPVALAATYYLQSYELNSAVVIAGLGPGLISMAILTVNNYRDIDSDAKSGKRTLAVRFGRTFAQFEYMACLLLAALVPVLIYIFIEDHKHILWASLSALLAIPGIHAITTSTDGKVLNQLLGYTGKILLVYSVVFSIGWIL